MPPAKVQHPPPEFLAPDHNRGRRLKSSTKEARDNGNLAAMGFLSTTVQPQPLPMLQRSFRPVQEGEGHPHLSSSIRPRLCPFARWIFSDRSVSAGNPVPVSAVFNTMLANSVRTVSANAELFDHLGKASQKLSFVQLTCAFNDCMSCNMHSLHFSCAQYGGNILRQQHEEVRLCGVVGGE